MLARPSHGHRLILPVLKLEMSRVALQKAMTADELGGLAQATRALIEEEPW